MLDTDFITQFNRINVRRIGEIVKKFEQTGSVEGVKTSVHVRTAENVAAVRDGVSEVRIYKSTFD